MSASENTIQTLENRDFFNRSLSETDPALARSIDQEMSRQKN